MIARLFRYEFKAGAVVFPASWGVILALFGLAALAEGLNLSVFTGFIVLMMVLVGIGAMIYAPVFAVIRYYKSMFGREAYLIQTLPVSKSKLLLSKLLLAVIYYIAGLVSIGLMLLSLSLLFSSVADAVWQFLGVFWQSASGFFYFYGLAMLFQSFQVISLIYFAITLANTKKFIKNSIAFSVLFYLAGNFAVGIINVLAMLFIPLGLESGVNGTSLVFKFYIANLDSTNAMFSGAPGMVGIGSLVTTLLLGVLFLVWTEKLLRAKASVK